MSTDKILKSALAHYQEGDFDKAAKVCNDILRNHPEDLDALRLLCLSYYQLQEHDLAIDCAQRAIRIDFDDYYSFFPVQQ